jgi:hypothetical protein
VPPSHIELATGCLKDLARRLQVEAMRDRVEGVMLDRAHRLVGDVHLATNGVGRLKYEAVVALPKDVNIERDKKFFKRAHRAKTSLRSIMAIPTFAGHHILGD